MTKDSLKQIQLKKCVQDTPQNMGLNFNSKLQRKHTVVYDKKLD